MAPAPPLQPVAIWPPVGAPVSAASCLSEFGAIAKACLAPPPFTADAARGHGQAVIVIPGFCCPNFSTARLRRFLTRQGFSPRAWVCGPNLGPTPRTVEAFGRQLTALAEETGAPVSLIGISLGGTIAREAAKRRPDCVACVITLVSPIRLPVATPLAPLVRLAARRWDPQARGALAQLAEPPPVPLLAIVSPTDGVVDWQACLPEPSDQTEVTLIPGIHLMMGSNAAAQRAIAARLAAT